MKKGIVAIQLALILFGIALIVYAIVHASTVIAVSPFPVWAGEDTLTNIFILLLFAIVLSYVLSVFRFALYWHRLYTIFLFFALVTGIFYLLVALFSPSIPHMLVYVIALLILCIYKLSDITIVHTSTQVCAILGILFLLSTHITITQSIIFLVLFSVYDMLIRFFPRYIFSVIAKLFGVDHQLSIVIPTHLRGWYTSHHLPETIAIRSIDIGVPLLCILLISYTSGIVLYSCMVIGWVGGIIIRLWKDEEYQPQLLFPVCGLVIGYAFFVLFLQ